MSDPISEDGSCKQASGPWWRGRFAVSIIFGALCFAIYCSNFRLISAGDNYPARYMPFCILKYGTPYLDPVEEQVAQGHTVPYWILHRRGHTVSTYPIVAPLLVTPLYVPAVAWLNFWGWTEQRMDNAARLMEKLSSALIASVSAALMYLVLLRRANARTAILLAAAFALGTNTWMIGSQALWQHGAGELLIIIALFILTGPCTHPRAITTGFVLCLIAFNRPPDALFSIAFGLYSLKWAAGRKRLLVLGAAAPFLLLLGYNLYVFKTFAGGYASKGDVGSFRLGVIPGVAGLLFSPARGLFVFSPFLLFVPFGLRALFRDRTFRNLDLLLLGAIVLQVICYAKLDWRAGSSWGPRWLTDILPPMVWMLAPVLLKPGAFTRIAFPLTVCISIAVQAIGAFWYTGTSDSLILSGNPDWNGPAWYVRNTPFLVELWHSPAPRELFPNASGYIDTLKINGHNVDKIPVGSEFEVEGWTLMDKHTPSAITVDIGPAKYVRGYDRAFYQPEVGTAFIDRPDVTDKMHGTGPSGWRVTMHANKFLPGDHIIEVMAKASDYGELVPVTRRHVMVVPRDSASADTNAADLAHAAAEATALLREHQQPGGYWLTSYTTSEQFNNPALEMNTFLTSMIVDLLDPVSSSVDMNDALAPARYHLADQIEANGLVRYHGRPDSPTIPSLGVVITPDSDDTALVWRIAGESRKSLLPDALKILESYKTPEGLYRTWLAPVSEYVSIDPGKDPNPADVGIQMHLLMLLHQSDTTAANALYTALQHAIGDDRIWVYYSEAPLVPLLRQGDLARLGYTLPIPPGHMQSRVPGQDPWVKACELLSRYLSGETPTPSYPETLDLLKTLAVGDFSAVHQNPPLIYHNDLTARARRFYWSEDFGYAVWLRLYMESTPSPKRNDPQN